MKKLIIQILFIIPVLVFTQGNTDQIEPDSTRQQVEIITRDGNEYIGEIVSENEQEIVLKTPSDITLTIAKNKIIERNEFSGKVEEGKVISACIGCTMVYGFLVLNIWESILDGLRFAF